MNTQVKIKDVNLKKVDNVLIQIPKWVVELWGLQPGDSLSLVLSEDAKSIIVKKDDSICEE